MSDRTTADRPTRIPEPTLTPYGEHAVLLDVGRSTEPARWVAAWAAALAGADLPGVLDLVPAARSVLMLLEDGIAPDLVCAAVARIRPAAGIADIADIADDADDADDRAVVEIAVVYDGPDLAEVAERTGLSRADVVAAHCGPAWRVGFAGFAPGFAYLVGGDHRLVVPRRESPRPQVPAGSVALAAGYSAVYPRASPGGWQLIGRTDASLWDLSRTPPALLTPGQRVRFRAVGP